jgi:tetratricopeptide (TPR) repeat protein
MELQSKILVLIHMNRTLYLVLPLLSLLLTTFAQNSDPALDKGLGLLQEARTILDEKSLSDATSYFTQLTQKDSNNAAYFYYLARVNAYRTDFYDNRHDKKNAEHSLEEAISSAQRALSINDKSAEFHSLLSDLYGRKIGFGGMFAGMRYGPKVDSESKRALALDSANPRAYASLGRRYLFAPKMFGGDVNKAVENFLKATQLDPKFDENFVWLAIAYRKKGDKENADKALQEALRLNPRSVFAKNTPEQK